MKWVPLITDETKKNYITCIIDLISHELLASPSMEPSLIGENAGVSIYWEYLFLYSKNPTFRNNSIRLINSSLDAISDKPLSYNLSGGVSGILWAYSHLVNSGVLQVKMNDVIDDEVNKFLVDSSKFDIQRYNYDYLHGGLSTLPYFLERIENEFCRKCIYELVIELEKVADILPEGISWMEGFHYISDKEKRYNLGLAHGMPSVIILLSRVLENNIAPEKTTKLLEGLINWILDKKQEDGVKGYFPTVIPSEKPYLSRISWCYGDLGIAIALLQASLVTKNNSWKEEAIMIAKNAASRREPNAGTIDACFCHGAAGNAHFFNRLYHYTEVIEFKEAAIYWYEETLRFYGINGHFKFFMRDPDGTNPRWEDKSGILEGISGIALTFLAAISDIEPKWDRCFLLS